MENMLSSPCAGNEMELQKLFLAPWYQRFPSIPAWKNNGAGVSADTRRNSALCLALICGCDIKAIRILLEEGADVNATNCAGRSLLCIALQHPDCNLDLVHLILNAGASKNACQMHKHLLHCYSANARHIVPGILKMLLIKELGRQKYRGESLCHALSMATCRADLVQEILEMGCYVNRCLLHESSFGCYFYENALMVSESKELDDEVVKLLLGSITEARMVYGSMQSPLCLALNHSKCTMVIVMLFLEAKASFRKCDLHKSNLHCLIDVAANSSVYYPPTNRLLKTDILELFLDRGDNIHQDGTHGISSLYMALHYFDCSAKVLRLFLDAGVTMDRCSVHGSILMCYVTTNKVKADVIKLFLDRGVDAHEVSVNGDTPLHSALRYSKYEVAAIEMLIDHPVFDVNKTGQKNSSFLHCALQNSYYKRNVVKLLLDRGARAGAVDVRGYTALHVAVTNPCCDMDTIKILLYNGCPIVPNNELEVTPLEIALKSTRRVDVVRLLLTAGAPINVKCITNDISLLELTLAYYDILQKQDDVDCLEMLVKYALLVNPHLDINNLIQGRIHSHLKRNVFLNYVNSCVNEIKCMDMQYVGPGVTLRQLAGDLNKDIVYDFSVLLKILASNEFPIYYDIISTRVKREVMESKLLKMHAYSRSELSCEGQRKIVLDSDSTCYIGYLLSDNDLLSYLVVYYVSKVC